MVLIEMKIAAKKKCKTTFFSMFTGMVLALFSALLLNLSYPKFNLDFLAWISLVPLFAAITGRRVYYTVFCCLTTGVFFFLGVTYWTRHPIEFQWNWVDTVYLSFYMGSYFAVFGLFFPLIERNRKTVLFPFAVAALWVSVEYLRSHVGFLSMPLFLIGHTQFSNLPLIQISSFAGPHGVSFLIVMVNAVIAQQLFLRFKDIKPFVFPLLIIAASLGFGYLTLSRPAAGKTFRVAVVQGNIPQERKWKPQYYRENLAQHIRLTRDVAENDRPSLIIWPETSVQGSLLNNMPLSQTLTSLAKDVRTPILFGSSQRPKSGSSEFRTQYKFNSAFLFSADGKIRGRYDKLRLLPFGEYLPHKDTIPWPEKFQKQIMFLPGEEYTVFNLDGVRFSTLICWESFFPELVRQFVRQGAQFMVNISNEAPFGDTAAPYECLGICVFRAVENRVSIVRSANTGISSFIDPYGRIMGKVTENNKDTFVEGHLTREIPYGSREVSLYTAYGDIFAFISIVGTALLSCISGFSYLWHEKGKSL